MEDLITKLQSDDPTSWRQARDELLRVMKEDLGTFQEFFPKILEIVAHASHESLAMDLACALRSAQDAFPNLSLTYSTEILDALGTVTERFPMDSNNSDAGGAASCLLTFIGTQLQQDQDLFQRAMPVLFQLLRKKHAVSTVAFGYINTWIYRTPRIFANHVKDLFQLARSGKKEILLSLMQMYPHAPEEFEQPAILEYLVETALADYSSQSAIMNILWEISKKKPELLAPFATRLRPTLQSPMVASLSLMILANVAREQPDAVMPLIPDIFQITKTNPQYKALIPNILGLVGRRSEETAAEMLSLLAEMLKDKDQATLVQILTEMKNLGEMNKELLTPHVELVKQFTEDPQEYIRTQAQAIIDLHEGRDLQSLMARFETLNEEIKLAVQSFDDLKRYVDQHVAELKEFIAEINKKLPIPSNFSSEGRIRKTLTLFFTCARQGDRCLFPKDRPFTTQTREFNRWLKVAISAVKLGVAAVTSVTPAGVIVSGPSMAGASLDIVRTLYDAITENPNDEEFMSIAREPFLTSEEQDFLITQLRDARYFQFFQYDAQTASWVCTMCAE